MTSLLTRTSRARCHIRFGCVTLALVVTLTHNPRWVVTYLLIGWRHYDVMWGFPRGFPNVIKLLPVLNPHKGYYCDSLSVSYPYPCYCRKWHPYLSASAKKSRISAVPYPRTSDADPTMFCKIVYGLVSIPFDAFFTFADCSSSVHEGIHWNCCILMRELTFVLIHFLYVVLLWNRLPAAIVLATDLHTKKITYA